MRLKVSGIGAAELEPAPFLVIKDLSTKKHLP